MEEMKKKKDEGAVEIPLDWVSKGGKSKLKVDEAGASCGNLVTWKWAPGKSGTFYVLFPDDSPFYVREFQCDTHGQYRASVVYNPETMGARRFKYIIAASDGDVMHILDPDIIVSKPGGRPGL